MPLDEMDDIINNPLEEEKEAYVGAWVPANWGTLKGFPQF
jgi:hypothetical protein